MGEFWLTDEQFAKIAPHLPTDTRGKERVDDRRVISGIIHVLKSGGRWTVVRWAAKGIWRDLFETLARAGGPPSQVLIDSSAVKAHRCASGGKGGSKAMPSAARGVDAPPRSTRSPTGSAARSPSC
ncbi:transposase [Methylobacterium sp. Leaf90]|nr:transposase [Methylobacterium sp. Leaf90]